MNNGSFLNKITQLFVFINRSCKIAAVNENNLFESAPTKGEQARQKLLLAALEKIGEKGYDGASVRDIARAAGQNVAAISYYFGNKENLYMEVLNGIVTYIWKAFGPVADEARALLESGKTEESSACELLQKMLKTLLMENIERRDIDKLRNVILREQSNPTQAFDYLYAKGLKPMHEIFTGLFAMASGSDPQSPVTIIRTHALFGQVMAFKVARTTIVRRLGVPKLEREQGGMIAAVVDEHIEIICQGLLLKAKSK